MDTYPGDLLTGVFPLVFAVDAILPTSTNSNDEVSSQLHSTPQPMIQRTSSSRSLFDRFLDAIASHLSDHSEEDSTPKASPRRSGTDTFASLLRGDDMFGGGEDSSDDEDISMDSSGNRRFRVGIGSPSLGMAGMTSARTARSISPHTLQPQSTAFARSLKLDGFFERARILSVSNRHGFPPSKDSTGQSNRALKLSQARSALAMNPTNANAIRLKRVLDNHPIEGILNAGWLEKHAAALPSVLLVVTSFQIYDKSAQDEQDAHVVETLEHLRESLASKRDCSIRLVCLADTPDQPTTPSKVDEWISRMKRDCDLPRTDLTMLQIPHDLESSSPGSSTSVISPMQKLHREVRDASWVYYQTLCRRVKRKLNILDHDHQPTLLPLAVRYCFKIGVFYEFLLRHTKALKYFYKAYRLLQTYYRQLLDKSLVWNPVTAASTVVNAEGDNIETNLADKRFGLNDNNDDTSGVEVALADTDYDDGIDDESGRLESSKSQITATIPLDIRKIFTDINPPFDMSNQCRRVADWLNFKLLQAGFQSSSFSESDQGILAASAQWRRHCRVFLKHDDPNDPLWGFWSYVSQQRLVMSQLAERFPPRSFTSFSGLAKEEVLMQCSAWRNYMAAAEAKLRLGVEVRKAVTDMETVSTVPLPKANLRGKFIGSMDSDGLGPWLHEESKRDHRELALDMLTRAVARFESELEKTEVDDDAGGEPAKCKAARSGARIFYLYGGILLGKQQYKDAIVYLERAVKYSQGWRGLELVIRRMLIECYEKLIPSQVTATKEQSATIASMILDSYFNSKMSSRNLRRALDNFSLHSGGDVFKLHRYCIDESTSSLPFSFAVTFPRTTHATAGDDAVASVMIKSNLDYAVHINSVTLLTLAGKILVPSNSLLSAENANEGNNGGIIMQANTSILLSTKIDVPRDLASISTDEGGNGGETLGTAGKGSFARSARPRTAGITSAAGARLVSENLFRKGPQDQNSQWNVRCLGGKPFRCDGICLLFYPVHVEKKAAASGISNVNIIELTIEKKGHSTDAEIRRTPFEEANFLASAWSRPDRLPLSLGPCCLRVLSPMPQMTVSNMTESLSGSKAIEGTVNRILLKLQAGPNELCDKIKFQIRCSSMLLSLDGTITHLNSVSSDLDLKKKGNNLRAPVLVYRDESSLDQVETDFGYSLPRGWKLARSDNGKAHTGKPSNTNLKPGEETYIYFDVFRPHRMLDPLDGVDETNSLRSSDGIGESHRLCQTDFDVTVSYAQARPKERQNLGRRKRKPAPGSVAPQVDIDSNEADVVTLEYTGSVIWTSPLSAKFDRVDDAQKAPPAGSRHPSNCLPDETSTTQASDATDEELQLALVDGELISTRCSLWANEMPSAIGIEVSRIWFEANASIEESINASCDFRLVGPQAKSSSLFEASDSDVCRQLGKGKKMGVLLTVMACAKHPYKLAPVSTHIGILCVDWAPKPLGIPPAAKDTVDIQYHGPLPLIDSSTIKFLGPACYIETAPFETSVSIHPTSPRVGTPFEIVFSIMNKANVHQVISVSLTEIERESSLLVGGTTKGDLRLAPQGTQLISYTVVAIKPGKVSIPSISIASPRYKTWLVRGTETAGLFILP